MSANSSLLTPVNMWRVLGDILLCPLNKKYDYHRHLHTFERQSSNFVLWLALWTSGYSAVSAISQLNIKPSPSKSPSRQRHRHRHRHRQRHRRVNVTVIVTVTVASTSTAPSPSISTSSSFSVLLFFLIN